MFRHCDSVSLAVRSLLFCCCGSEVEGQAVVCCVLRHIAGSPMMSRLQACASYSGHFQGGGCRTWIEMVAIGRLLGRSDRIQIVFEDVWVTLTRYSISDCAPSCHRR